jgi:tRNA (uracil-5-)-methyltransferase TRM9
MYSTIATAFDKTRYKVWPCVREFLTHCSHRLPRQNRLLEAGVGNGKNLEYASECGFVTTGFDVCKEFVDIAQARCPSSRIFQQDLCMPVCLEDEETFDVILCIAVLHHIQSETERRAALKRLISALAPDGILLLTVWSYETFDAPRTRAFALGDTFVPWKDQSGAILTERYYHVYDRKGFEELVKSTGCEAVISWERQNWVARISRGPRSEEEERDV